MSFIQTTRRGFLAGLAALIAAPVAAKEAVARLFLPKPTFDSFSPPEGSAYQWCAKTIMGKPEPFGHFEGFLLSGWRPVPAARYKSEFAIKGDEIEIGGQVLMERPLRAVNAERQREIDAANNQVNEWMESVKAQGFDVHVGYAQGPVEYRQVSFRKG